ncbi:MAG: porin PorA family protein [Jatrophihabitantaceae bacterium]
MRKTLAFTGLALGLALLLSAGVVRWIIAPNDAVLPSNTNTTRAYAGTAAVLFNPAALTTGSGPVLLTNVPVTVAHQTKVLATSGGNALVSDAKTIKAAGSTVAAVDYRYSVDRTNLGQGSHFSGVLTQTGLTFNWPIRTAAHDYTGYVPDTGKTTTLKYTGTATRGGITTDVFTTVMTPAAITDAQQLAELPKSLPKATLLRLAPSLNLPAAQLAALANMLPQLPDPVPFGYTYQGTATYYVAPQTGIVVDLVQHETRTLTIQVGTAVVPVTPVMDITFTDTPATLVSAVNDARTKGDSINLLYRTLPISLTIGGVVLMLLGGFALAVPARRRDDEDATTDVSHLGHPSETITPVPSHGHRGGNNPGS